MNNTKQFSRRSFLKSLSALSAMSAMPGLWLSSGTFMSCTTAQAKPRMVAPNEKVNIACIGIGNRGNEIIKMLYNTGLCNVVALCDVDMEAAHTTEILKMFPKASRFKDFRVMFDKMNNQIDAVSIAVPDHSHFPATMLAMSLGKHVYVEKPLARTFLENELLIEAARKYGVVTQMGNQGHSEENYFQFKAWKEAGIIKDVTAITAHMNNPRRWHGWDTSISRFPAPEPIPETLDWDLWLVGQPSRSFNKDFINGQWRCWYDFGMGALGDWGAHILDTAHEFLDLGLPTEVSMVQAEGHNDYFYPQSSTILFRFPARGEMPPVDITWYDGVNNIPAVPEGYGVSELDPNIPLVAGGKIQPAKLNPGKIIYSKELIFKGGSHGSALSIIPEEKARDMAASLPEVQKSTSNHFENFLLACRGQEKTRSPFSVSGPLSQVFSLGVLAQRMNSKLLFDRESKTITNNTVANNLLTAPEPRKGWEEFYRL
ncbi:MAG: Gfo/Idh/MocA family oxidoreductase [Bacteroidales bacterium]